MMKDSKAITSMALSMFYGTHRLGWLRITYSQDTLTLLPPHPFLHTPPFTTLPSHSSIHNPPFTLLPSHSSLHTPPFTTLPSHSSLHTPPFTPLPSHSFLYTPPFTPLPSHSSLHNPPFTPLPSHSSLHIPPFTLLPSHPPFTTSHRTVITVIELLAAVCLVKGGHEKILEAVDNFKKENGEQYRFEKLVQFFMSPMASSELQVACMNFINVIVHSAEEMNFRVYLQHEFSLLGLDDYLLVKWEGERERGRKRVGRRGGREKEKERVGSVPVVVLICTISLTISSLVSNPDPCSTLPTPLPSSFFPFSLPLPPFLLFLFYIQELKASPSVAPLLLGQIAAYEENYFNVASLVTMPT